MPARSSANGSSGANDSAETVSLTFPPRPEHVSLARLVAATLAQRHGVTVDVVEEIRLLVSEACTNAVRAQLAQRVDDPIVLLCVLDGDFRLEISDRAGGIPPDMVDHGFPDRTSTVNFTHGGGFGIPLMRRLADHTQFRANESGGTTVVLTLGTEHMDAAQG
jgi:serine/threonine-protein kinase RsbW